MGKALAIAAALLLGACSSGPNYADPNYRPPQQMDPNARMMMLMYGMQQLQQSMQPPAMPAQQGFTCYGGGGYIRCQ